MVKYFLCYLATKLIIPGGIPAIATGSVFFFRRGYFVGKSCDPDHKQFDSL